MALEDLTGTSKFVSALNPAWPVDDDWVDEGDNHIRGIKNVLKNSFPDTDGAVHWSATQARFPDGVVGVPGISWIAETDSGIFRSNARTFTAGVGGVSKWSWSDVLFWVQPVMQFRADGPGLFNGPVTVAALSGGNGKLTVSGGFAGTLATLSGAPVVVSSLGTPGTTPGIALTYPAFVTWGIYVVEADGTLAIGTTQASGPAGLGGKSMVIAPNGAVSARSFNQVTVAVSAKEPIAEALAGVLKLRGVRGFQRGNEAR